MSPDSPTTDPQAEQAQATPSPDTAQPAFAGMEPPPKAEVLYRKWRPQSFAEVVGQEAVTRTLRNSIASGRLSHAYLLAGPRGTGKTSLGRLIAKAANCADPAEGEPCNRCDSCRAFLEGRAMDFIEQDAASHNSVDDIRQLRENVVLNPMSGKYKVYLLDEAHMLTPAAENALLKTLEEPPPHIIFVLATTEPHKVSATIISRCQRFDLRRIPLQAAVELLAAICEKEGFSLDQGSLQEVARNAGGSLRDAINALEQIVTYYGDSPTLEQVREALGISADARSAELARLLLSKDIPEGLKLIAAVRDDGVDMRRFSREVVGYLRGLLLVKAGAGDTLDLPKETVSEMQALAREVEPGEIVAAVKALGRIDFRDDPLSPLPLELALIELASEGVEEAPPASKPAARKAEAPAAPPSEPEVKEPEPPAPTAAAASEEPAAAAAGVESEPQPSSSDAPEESETATPPTAEQEESETPPREEAAAASGASADDQRLLDRVREACKESDKQLAALLNASCEVKSIEGDALTLGFYHTFHLERMEAGGYLPRLNELFSQALGRPVSTTLVHAPRRPTTGKVKSGHLVQAAQELGARPIGKGEESWPSAE